jgi:F-type H+-transporting ATPase subunit b
MLSLDYNILWTFVNLIVLYLLMKKFLFGPINAMMEKRTSEIEGSIESAKKSNSDAEQLKSEYELALQNAKTEASEIRKAAKQRIQEEHDLAIKLAEADAAKVMLAAQKAIESEKIKSMESIQSEISSIALIAASKIMKANMNSETNNQIIDEFLTKAGTAQ